MDQRPKRTRPRPTDRRRIDRRSDWIALGEYPVPELRKASITVLLLAFILVLFTYMVHEVVVGAIAGAEFGRMKELQAQLARVKEAVSELA